MMNKMQISPESVIELLSNYQKSRVLLTGIELNVFSAIENQKSSSNAIAKKVGADTRALDRLMNALSGLGFLNKVKCLFSNTDFSKKYLCENSKEYMLQLGHIVNMNRNWSRLTDAVRRGKSVGVKRFSNREQKWFESFISAMHSRAVWQAKEIIPLLKPSGMKVLDIGGGSGAHAIEFIRHNAKSVCVFDLPKVIPLTRRYVRKENMERKIIFRKGDFLKDEFGSGFDIVFISAIIHMLNPKEIRKLFVKSASALADDGKIVVQDFFMSDDRTDPLRGALFALNMLVGTAHGDTYTETEVREWLIEAGFGNIYRIDTTFEAPLLLGKK